MLTTVLSLCVLALLLTLIVQEAPPDAWLDFEQRNLKVEVLGHVNPRQTNPNGERTIRGVVFQCSWLPKGMGGVGYTAGIIPA